MTVTSENLPCDRPVLSRGNCRPHYMHHRRLVHLGRATWEQLEREGKTLPRSANGVPWLPTRPKCPHCNGTGLTPRDLGARNPAQ